MLKQPHEKNLVSMISIFIALAIVSLFEIGYSAPLEYVNPAPSRPACSLGQIANIVSNAHQLMSTFADLEPDAVAQMMPHLCPLAKIFQGTPLSPLFSYLEYLGIHHNEFYQVKILLKHLDQFVERNDEQVPVPLIINNKTKVKMVYNGAPYPAPRGPFPAGAAGVTSGTLDYAEEVIAHRKRIATETTQDLEQLKSKAQEARTQVVQELVKASDSMQKQVQEAKGAAKGQLTEAMNAMQAEAEQAYANMNQAVAWLYGELQKRMTELNAQLEEQKRSYKADVDGYVAEILGNLETAHKQVEQQMSQATGGLQQHLNTAKDQLNSQLQENRNQMSDEMKKMTEVMETQLQGIRQKMREGMQELQQDMQNTDAELRQGIADAAGAKRSAEMNAQSQAEVAKIVADMKTSTEQLRKQMEQEMRQIIQDLKSQVDKLLLALKNGEVDLSKGSDKEYHEDTENSPTTSDVSNTPMTRVPDKEPEVTSNGNEVLKSWTGVTGNASEAPGLTQTLPVPDNGAGFPAQNQILPASNFEEIAEGSNFIGEHDDLFDDEDDYEEMNHEGFI